MLFFFLSFFPFYSYDGLSASRCVPQPVSGIIIKHLYTMIILNTVIARLANYSASLFPMYLLNHCHVQFFFLFFGKTMETFSAFCLRESAESPLFAVCPCPSERPSFVLAIIEIPLI